MLAWSQVYSVLMTVAIDLCKSDSFPTPSPLAYVIGVGMVTFSLSNLFGYGRICTMAGSPPS